MSQVMASKVEVAERCGSEKYLVRNDVEKHGVREGRRGKARCDGLNGAENKYAKAQGCDDQYIGCTNGEDGATGH